MVLISKVAIVFLNFSLKILKEGIYFPKFEFFFILHKFLNFDQLQGTDFQYQNSFFQISAIKYRSKILLVPDLKVFDFHEFFHFNLFESADFEYGNSFFQLPV